MYEPGERPMSVPGERCWLGAAVDEDGNGLGLMFHYTSEKDVLARTVSHVEELILRDWKVVMWQRLHVPPGTTLPDVTVTVAHDVDDAFMLEEEPTKTAKKSGRREDHLSVEEIRPLFHLPQAEAAEGLGVW